MSKITLQCVKNNGKLRIRFFSFTDQDGKVFTNVYNNEYNCRFPRNIRKEGLFYEIGPDDIRLSNNPNKAPFYIVKKANIKVIEDIDIGNLKIYEVNECVICLDSSTSEIFLPCGHLCTCKSCCFEITKRSNKCPLCRRQVTNTITNPSTNLST